MSTSPSMVYCESNSSLQSIKSSNNQGLIGVEGVFDYISFAIESLNAAFLRACFSFAARTITMPSYVLVLQW